MATFTKTNPVSTLTNFGSIGRQVSFFTVNYGADASISASPAGVQTAVLNQIMQLLTILIGGPLFSGNTQQTFAIEGITYTPSDVTLTSSSYLQDLINVCGVIDGINTANITVTPTSLAIASSAAVTADPTHWSTPLF